MKRYRKLACFALLLSLSMTSVYIMMLYRTQRQQLVGEFSRIRSVFQRHNNKTMSLGQLLRLANLYDIDIYENDHDILNRAENLGSILRNSSSRGVVSTSTSSARDLMRSLEMGRDMNSKSTQYRVTEQTSRSSNLKHGMKNERCSKADNVMFLKTHKTGSDTTTQLLLRYGDLNNLSVVLPKGEWNLGWPKRIQAKDYLPSNKPFNLFCLHTVYDRSKMATLMPDNTKFVTILRNPWSQFKSAFNYFKWNKLVTNSRITTDIAPLEFFLQNQEEFYRQEKYRLPYLRNFMTFDLGFPPHQYDNASAIADYITELDDNFQLVMILEYFEESLVLLRRILCWKLTDVLYIPINVSPKQNTPADDLENLYKNFSQADYALYGHFKEKLLDQISHEPEFDEELNFFRKINSNFKMFCLKVIKNESLTMKIEQSKWNDEHILDGEFCRLSRLYLIDYVAILKYKLHNIPLNPDHKPYLWPISR
ncbi:galactosylceramide sulfotransferase-like [Glandiceps talaboti]